MKIPTRFAGNLTTSPTAKANLSARLPDILLELGRDVAHEALKFYQEHVREESSK